MKALRLTLGIVIAFLLITSANGLAQTFHSGGVANCGGCHSMHAAPAGGSSLLINADASSTCLNCHMHVGDTGPSSYHIASADADMPAGVAPLQRTPGGDFGWLHKTYTFTLNGTATVELGQTHGHNIVANDFAFVADSELTTAPGGTFPAAQLSCTSCHNQHGTYRRLSNGTISTTTAPIIGSGSYDNSFGNSAANPIPAGQAVGVYRLLWGAGGTVTGGASYTGVPAAVAPATYNRTEATFQTRVAYGAATASGQVSWGTWCGTCHGSFHVGLGSQKHPIDWPLGSTIGSATGNYTLYVSSGIMTGVFTGNQANQGPYTSLVPFSENTGDYTVLGGHAKIDGSQLGGPGTADQVTCLSCHRAHASGFPDMLRWNMEGEFITVADSNGIPTWPGINAPGVSTGFSRGRTVTEMQGAYYDRNVLVFGAWQRGLCNKCHAKD